jgi:hypothetical protein
MASGRTVESLRDMKMKNGDVLPRGTRGTLFFIRGDFRYCNVLFNWIGPSGRNYTQEPMKTQIELAGGWLRGMGKPPSVAALTRMSDNAVATTPTGKRVEPDGVAADGSPSWLLVMGLI